MTPSTDTGAGEQRLNFRLARKGYDCDEVDSYLIQIADQIDDHQEQIGAQAAQIRALEAENAELSESVAAVSTASDPPISAISHKITALLEQTDDVAVNIRAEADEYAETVRAGADVDAERIVIDARSEVAQLVKKATADREAAEVRLAAARSEASDRVAAAEADTEAMRGRAHNVISAHVDNACVEVERQVTDLSKIEQRFRHHLDSARLAITELLDGPSLEGVHLPLERPDVGLVREPTVDDVNGDGIVTSEAAFEHFISDGNDEPSRDWMLTDDD